MPIVTDGLTLATADLTFNVADLIGTDFDARRTKVWIEANVPTIVDRVGKVIHLGDAKTVVGDDGTGAFTGLITTDSTDVNPTGFLYRVWVDYATRSGQRKQWNSGWFPLTATSDLALVAAVENAPPPIANVDSALTAELGDPGSLAAAAIRALIAAGIEALAVSAAAYPSLQAALTAGAGKRVFIPAGTWTEGVTIPANTTIYGTGPSTVLKVPNGYNADFIKNAPGDGGITIDNLAIDGNKANQTLGAQCRGIYLIDSAYLELTRLWIRDVEGHGIHLSNGTTPIRSQRLSDVVIERCGRDPLGTYGSGFATTNAYDVTLTAVRSTDHAKAGFRLSGSGFILNGCVGSRNNNGGVVPVSGDNSGVVINGGFFQDNGPNTNCDGIRLVGAKNVVLNGPVVSGNYGAGLGIYNSTTNVTGHVFAYNNGKAGGTAPTVEGRDGVTIGGDSTAVTDVALKVFAYDDQATKTQQRGVRLRGLVDNVSIADDSNLRGNLNGPFANESTTATSIRLGKVQGLSLWTTDVTANTVTGTTAETDLKTVTVPGKELGRRSGLRLRASGTTSGTSGTKQIRFKLGGTSTIAVAMAATPTSDWAVEVEVWNTETNAQNVTIRGFEGASVDVLSWSSLAVDTTASFAVGVTATLAVATDSVVCRSFTLEPL